MLNEKSHRRKAVALFTGAAGSDQPLVIGVHQTGRSGFT